MAIDMELLLDSMRQVESGGDSYAVSPVGAKGPYQFMDATAAQYGVTNPFDETQSRNGARRYMNDLIKQFDGSVEHAIVAYNGGPNRLQKRGSISAMPEESQLYLQKVMAEYASQSAKSNTQYLETVRAQPQPISPLESLPEQETVSALEALFPQSRDQRLFSETRSDANLQTAVLQPQSTDKARRVYEMQLRTGLPVSVIERNLDEIETQTKRADFNVEKFRAESPLLADWLAKNPTRAALAQGDYENLAFLEKAMANLKAIPAGAEIGFKQERMGKLGFKAAMGTLTPQEDMERQALKKEIETLNREVGEDLPKWFKEASSVLGMQIPMLLKSAKTGVQYGLPAGAIGGAAVGALGGTALGALGGPPGIAVGGSAGALAGAAAGGVLGAKAFTMASIIEQTYEMSVGEALNELEDAKDVNGNPIDPVAARYASLLVALPNAAMEYASLRMAVKVIPGADKVVGKLSTQAMKQVLTRPSVVAALAEWSGKYATSVGTETFTEGMQNFLAVIAREIVMGEKGTGITKEDIKGIREDSYAAFQASVVLLGTGFGPKVLEIRSDIQTARKNEEFMRALGDATSDSKTFANSPKAFSEYITHLKENGLVKNIFVPIEQWDMLFQDKAPDAAREVFGTTEQYAEAETLHGDLVIPLEVYAEKLAGTQFHEKLVPHIRFNPGEMTPTEAVEAQELQPEIEAGLQKETETAIVKEAPHAKVYEDVFGKLIQAGVNPIEADRDAALWRERNRTRAERLGMDPMTLYAEQPLTIRRTEDGSVVQQGAFAQPAFHGTPFKFDKFSLEHLGKGEGAQAYGWGLYFAGNKNIAEWYRENLTQQKGLHKKTVKLGGKNVRSYMEDLAGKNNIDPFGGPAIILENIISNNASIENLEFEVDKLEKFSRTNLEAKYATEDLNDPEIITLKEKDIHQHQTIYDDIKKMVAAIRKDKPLFEYNEPSKGQLYKVEVPDDEHLLVFDKPIAQQSKSVQKFFKDNATIGGMDFIVPPDMTGESAYYKLGQHLSMIGVTGNKPDKAASLFFNEFGIKGHKYLDASSRGGAKKSYNYVIYDDTTIDIVETYYQEKRGFSVPTKNLIALLKDADPTTFIHESGHIWLEEMRQDALRPDAPEQVLKDWAVIKEWAGIGDEAISVESHEKFARGIEAFFMEGKSPSIALRAVFAQVKDWMYRIYKSMTMLDVELTPEVRDVFDRLLASDELIKQARERNEYHVPLLDRNMMTEAEYEAYRALNEATKAEAEDSFRAKVMKELRREKLQVWRDRKNELTPIVREEILQIPIQRAAYWLYSGKLPDGSEIEGMTSHKLDKAALLELGVDLKTVAFRYQENGLSPDVVAGIFGFPTGESMVRDLVGLPPLKQSIDEEVSRRIREETGGIVVEGVTDEQIGMEVQNTRQIDVFNMELRLLKRFGAKREASHPAVLKDIAHRMVERKTLRELDPRIFEDAALRAGQEAQDALLGQEFRAGTGRNLDIAFDAKQRQMLNIFLYKEATEVRANADKAIKTWKKFLGRSDERLAKTYNMDLVNAARAIAAAHGVGGAAADAATYMRQLAQYDPQSYEDMKDLVETASSDGRNILDLSVGEFTEVKNAIDGLWALARRSMQAEIDGKKIDRKQITGELNARIGELVKPGKKRAGYDRAISNWDKTKMALLGAKAMLRRAEFWVDAMDDGDPNGVFRKYIWQPISEAADNFREQRKITREKYLKIAEAFPKDSMKMGEIAAPELGYVFKNKTELLGAMRHMGNPSSLQKLLRGREWGVFDAAGELDTRKWDAFLDRMHTQNVLTKADYDYLQSVWDLFEELKPEAQKAHREMYGYYFNELTRAPVKTPFGIYKGGYYPANADPLIVEDAAIRGEQAALESQPSSFLFPTTGRGFTKQRTEAYAKPLAFDLATVPQDLDKVLRFTYLEPHIKDVGRVAIDKDFRSHLAQLDSEVGSVMLMPWLQRSAQQLVEQPSGPRMAQFDKFFHEVRTRSAMQIMTFHAANALQQLTGIAGAALKVNPRYLAGAMWHLVKNPTNYGTTIAEASVFMRNRNATQLMEAQKSIDNILLNPSKYEKAKAFANEHAYFMQVGMQNFVDKVVWGGAYEQAVAQGFDEKTAIRVADSAVRETQGSFAPEDISRFEAGPAHLRVFTMFYSYFNMVANLNATEFTKALRRGGFSGGGRALYVYAFGFMIPAVVAEAITQAFSGDLADDEDDDGYLDDTASLFFGSQFRMATAMVPIIGPIVQVGINAYNDKWYDDRINASPAVSMVEGAARAGLGYDAYKVATEENARLNRPVKDLFTLIGMATGLPVTPLAKPIGYLTDIEQGYVNPPTSAIEATRGLVSGKAPK